MNVWEEIKSARSEYIRESAVFDEEAKRVKVFLEQKLRGFLGKEDGIYLEFVKRLGRTSVYDWENTHNKPVRDEDGFYHILVCIPLPYPIIKFPISIGLSRKSDKANLWLNMARDKEKFIVHLFTENSEIDKFMQTLTDDIIEYYKAPLRDDKLSKYKNIQIGFINE